jgi:subtilisin family serine protease
MTAIFDKLPPGIFGLPLDLSVGEDWEQSSVPAVWHLPRSLWDVIWGKGWTGKGEVIAILDTGVNPHNLLPRPIAERSFVPGQRPTDNVSGHGTHCAGTALGRGGIGVAPEAELINVKVLSDQGSGSSTGIAQGIRWAVDEGATIISMSLGSSSPHRPTQEAMQYAAERGVTVVSAAGNSGQRPPNNTIGYPARYLESGCIGAKQQNGQIASFSSAGREMDMVCPGQGIVSTSNFSRTGYRTMSGTSMACPFAAGLIAVIRSGMRQSGAARLGGIEHWRGHLPKYAIDKGPRGHDPTWGWGVPDYERIVAYLAAGEIEWA